MKNLGCVLCGGKSTKWILKDDTRMDYVRDYYICDECNLIFVDPKQRLDPDEEKSRYEMHENDPDDPGYRKFLSRLFKPMSQRIEPNSYGLDFGSGPGPTLSLMFEEAGHTVRIYDPFYADDPSVFDDQYDFITTTETAEHLYDPLSELDRLWSCLKPCGYLGIMTKRHRGAEHFKNWHYKNDDTHVVFYHEDTFRWLGNRWDSEPEFLRSDVVIFGS
ncbi:class I SAM-dependent methyltransferase [Rhodohalobacter sp. 8-1]|uniref:class I SAM-dependent methyltransferase n=1 Tax=Rhodohalobacter sp. 8-1 TaxID=3131972 RepID=UPI0030EBC392